MQPTGATDPYGANTPADRTNPRHAVEIATLVIIAATLVAVVASSWPLFLTWLDGERAEPARPGIARALRSRGWAVAPARDRHRSVFGPSAPMPPQHGRVPGLDIHKFPIPRAERDRERGENLAGAIAKPLTIVQLLDRADPDGRPVISVNPNETLVVMREVSPWLLLAVKRNGRMEFGWTTRSQVAISR